MVVGAGGECVVIGNSYVLCRFTFRFFFAFVIFLSLTFYLFSFLGLVTSILSVVLTTLRGTTYQLSPLPPSHASRTNMVRICRDPPDPLALAYTTASP